ncbi:CoA transferase [Roseovarius spongiae]|uniref:CoA transferase n=1 Tax=Roseovarius spongiae TaxID=2320272 RepID=UPI001FEA1C96|nr:CoA transferase [Roseovarius spongiae]
MPRLGKESIALDLKSDADKAVPRAMIARADIFIQNLGPGVIDRLGFGAGPLREERPDLIMCSIAGYGGSGPATLRAEFG